MQNLNFLSPRIGGLFLLMLSLALVTGCASERRQTVSIEAAPGATVRQISNDTVQITSDGTIHEAAGAQPPKK